jgi:hypothetical protein
MLFLIISTDIEHKGFRVIWRCRRTKQQCLCSAAVKKGKCGSDSVKGNLLDCDRDKVSWNGGTMEDRELIKRERDCTIVIAQSV